MACTEENQYEEKPISLSFISSTAEWLFSGKGDLNKGKCKFFSTLKKNAGWDQYVMGKFFSKIS